MIKYDQRKGNVQLWNGMKNYKISLIMLKIICIVDISYKYGYNSPTSFTKAFQQFHGISPKEARVKNIDQAVVPKMQITSKQKYSWKLERKQSLRLVGKGVKISCADNEHYLKIPKFWSV